MQTEVPVRARRRPGMSVDVVWKSVILGLERRIAGTLSMERQMPWILTLEWFSKRYMVIRRAILPVKPAMATVVFGDILIFVDWLKLKCVDSKDLASGHSSTGDSETLNIKF